MVGGAGQVLSVGFAAFALRALLKRNKNEDDIQDDDRMIEPERPGLPVVPTLLFAAGWSLVTWINAIHKEDLTVTEQEMEVATDLKNQSRSIVVCTTASVPWLTGTAVNPAIRAVKLAKRGHNVMLLVPWLIPEDQPIVFSGQTLFSSPEEQTKYVSDWLEELLSDEEKGKFPMPRVQFYFGGYAKDVGSVFPLSDIVTAIGTEFERDVLVMEEPEHLTWYYFGDKLTSQFRFVVGVIHTNYVAYALNWDFPIGIFKGAALWFYNKWCTRAHTHRIIKLSDAMQGFPRQITANVHGTRDKFVKIGKETNPEGFTRGAYFVGKLVWQKGYNRLIPLLKEHYKATGESVAMEWFGAGEDFEEIRKTVIKEPALRNVIVKGVAIDHSNLTDFKVLVNASDSEGLATVTLEALAMGKSVVIPVHPCNNFFSRFSNAYLYRNKEEFSIQLDKALEANPARLGEYELRELSWEAGTDRFIEACSGGGMRGSVRYTYTPAA